MNLAQAIHDIYRLKRAAERQSYAWTEEFTRLLNRSPEAKAANRFHRTQERLARYRRARANATVDALSEVLSILNKVAADSDPETEPETESSIGQALDRAGARVRVDQPETETASSRLDQALDRVIAAFDALDEFDRENS